MSLECHLEQISNNCKFAATNFSQNEIGLALANACSAILLTIKSIGNIETVNNILNKYYASSQKNSVNKKIAISLALLYETEFFCTQSNLQGILSSLSELLANFNICIKETAINTITCDNKSIFEIAKEIITHNLTKIEMSIK